MGPLAPKAISLCFFSKLVLQSGVRVLHDARTCSPLLQCVVTKFLLCHIGKIPLFCDGAALVEPGGLLLVEHP